MDKWIIAPSSVGSLENKAISAVSPTSPISTTNTQVAWVDEGDRVKTDGKYIYTLRNNSETIEVVDVNTLKNTSTISIAKNSNISEMYLSAGKLIVLGSKYSYADSYTAMRWYNPDNKTIVFVYDVSHPEKPVLQRSVEIDGSYKDSRLVGDTLYFLAQSDLRIAPYYMNLYTKSLDMNTDILPAFDKNFSLNNIVPQIRESVQNPRNTQKYITSVRSGVSRCQDLSFILPDEKVMKNLKINPVFTTIASLKISSLNTKVQTSLIFGDVSQIHMSEKNLYLVSDIYKNSPSSKCPPNAKCIAPMYYNNSSTLIHRFALVSGKVQYKNTTEVSGTPLNQYSMDEDLSWNFRIVTQNSRWSNTQNTSSTSVFIVDPLGKKIGSLTGIAEWENFQSSRFIANRLYLVTFEQIDPLFVIDLSNSKPTILGELKMPGYSTYLHPYDNDRLIGIGYDTVTNTHGWIQNGWLKIDLYNVADVKNPKKEASLTMGDAWSSSEVLNNPRAFTWYKEKNLLLLPTTLMTSAKDPNDTYRSSKAFQWVAGVSILPNSIVEKFRVTHLPDVSTLSDAWKKDCTQYKGTSTNSCVKLLDGSNYCPPSPVYVPPYCYADATVDTYFANNLWNYQNDFINRSVYIGEKFYTIAEGGVKSWDFSNTTIPTASLSFPIPKEKIYPPMIAY